MADIKHIRGPWMAAAGPSSVVGWPIVGPMGRMIAEVSHIKNLPVGVTTNQVEEYNAECKANAHLIAAAPDLLELAWQYRNDLRHPLAPDSRERRLKAIDAVLAKAEGRS